MKQFATITVIGRDKTGVIARVTNFLFELHANIEALEEQVTRGQFSMTLQASWKKSELDASSLRAGLEKLARQLGMEIKLRLTEPNRRQRFAIMVTKETHCFDALMAAKLKADPALVIGNYANFAPLAKKHQLPFAHLNWHDRAKSENTALKLLEEQEIDFVVLARFMKILSPNFVWRHKNKIINTFCRVKMRCLPVSDGYGSGFIQKQHINISGSFNGLTRFGNYIGTQRPIHACNTYSGKQASYSRRY